LIGGETAEHPRAFTPGEYDLAGFAVGVVEKSKAIDGRSIAAGDVLIGLASSGPHSNGFSLIRRIVESSGADLKRAIEGVTGTETLGEALLTPTRIYVKPVLALLAQTEIKGMAHITGGGLRENTHRMFGPGLAARIDSTRWPRPPIFDWLQRMGKVESAEMHRVFNCGIGLVLVVDPETEQAVIDRLVALGEAAYVIGAVERQKSGSPGTVIV
jgi:phosphoribosylformylglycinamidine cyclo-ligase